MFVLDATVFDVPPKALPCTSVAAIFKSNRTDAARGDRNVHGASQQTITDSKTGLNRGASSFGGVQGGAVLVINKVPGALSHVLKYSISRHVSLTDSPILTSSASRPFW